MSLIRCKDCGMQVSKTASKCPRCGNTTISAKGKFIYFTDKILFGCLGLLILLLILILYSCGRMLNSIPK